jgi:uroporphyrinogen III methyltransferase / synthase
MKLAANSRALSGRTFLFSPNQPAGELATDLTGHGARVLGWPKLDTGEPGDYEGFDEAIENLFGYDWLIFQNALAVNYFLGRWHTLGHQISELDSLRVCGVGEEASAGIEESQVHVDVIPNGHSFQTTVDAIESYVGGPEALRGLNFLVPGASNSRVYLQEALEAAGARVDLVTAYRTCAVNDPEPGRIDALITGGGIDCIVFESPAELRAFAAVFDTNDLGRLLAGVIVACSDTTMQTAATFNLTADIVGQGSEALSQAIAAYFCGDSEPPVSET